MKQKTADLALVAAWVIYIALLGPFLISAPSSIAVVIGILVAIVLAFFTWRRFNNGGNKSEQQ
jgi:hypothetical protein